MITSDLSACLISENPLFPKSRITESLSPEHQVQQFTYDPAGDLADPLPDQGLRTTRYNQTRYQYDAAGNLVQRQQDETTQFTWDENNRLKTIRKPDNTVIIMGYDALGRRHRKAVNGERTFFTWDNDALLSEQFEDGPIREYVYYPGTFEPLAVIEGDGTVYYYHNDPNGLSRELTRYNGEVVWSATYDALGRVDKILVDEVAQPLRMKGQYWDEEIGLCYNHQRYFDPQICAFISQDPIGLAGGDNVYAYSPNVWGWIDPLGLSGFLTIHSSGNGGSLMMSGHSWISYKPDSTGKVTTYGTWGNNPTGKGNGLFKNLELGQVGDASRTIHIDDVAEANLFNHIDQSKKLGPKGWTFDHPCSGFASDSWQVATGEKLKANWGPINNPTTLKQSIKEINGGAYRLEVGSHSK